MKLNELCNVTSSKRIFASQYQNSGIPFYRGKEISLLSNNEKKRLVELLQYEQFQSNLMREEGAVDRIYQKVAENETGDSRDVMALFETSDFEVDVNFCDDMITNGAAKNAMKMMNGIMKGKKGKFNLPFFK